MNAPTRYFLGLDVGGTKTYCLVIDESGAVRGFGRAGTGSYEYHGVAAALAENEKAVQAALADAGISMDALTGVGLGVAGADLPEDYEMLERELYAPLFGDIPRVFRNDSFGALRGGTRQPYGIAIACGTDTVCAGRNPQKEETRVGGFGPEFGNECSGVLLGKAALNALFQAREGIIPPTLITDKLVRRAGVSDADSLFLDLYHGRMSRETLEPVAPLVFEAAVEGDAKACDILMAGGRFLGAMVNAVARKLRMEALEFEVVMAGSVFRDGAPVLADAMRETIAGTCPKAWTRLPLYEPVVGGVLMGMEPHTEITDEVHRRLAEGLRKLEERVSIRFMPEEV